MCSSAIGSCRARLKISLAPLPDPEEVEDLDVTAGSLDESYSRAGECIEKKICVRRRATETKLQAALSQQRIDFLAWKVAQDEALLRIAGKSEKHAIEARLQDLRGKVAAAQEIKDGHIRVLETLVRARGQWQEREHELEGLGVSFPVARMRQYFPPSK